MVSNKGWAVVDVETTGYDPQTCHVLSVAALALSPDGTIEHTINTLLNPGITDPGPTHVHGLTIDMLAGATQFADVADELGSILRGRTLVAHNAEFDHSFLLAEARRAKIRLPMETRLCTVELASLLGLGIDNLKLSTLAAHYHVSQQRPHDALDDATVLAGVFRGLLDDAAHQSVALPIRPADHVALQRPA